MQLKPSQFILSSQVPEWTQESSHWLKFENCLEPMWNKYCWITLIWSVYGLAKCFKLSPLSKNLHINRKHWQSRVAQVAWCRCEIIFNTDFYYFLVGFFFKNKHGIISIFIGCSVFERWWFQRICVWRFYIGRIWRWHVSNFQALFPPYL